MIVLGKYRKYRDNQGQGEKSEIPKRTRSRDQLNSPCGHQSIIQ